MPLSSGWSGTTGAGGSDAWDRGPRGGGGVDCLCAEAAEAVAAVGGDGDDLAAAGADLFDVADHLVVLRALRGDEDDRHAVVDQRDRPVLHLGGGHALGVNVADFLEF